MSHVSEFPYRFTENDERPGISGTLDDGATPTPSPIDITGWTVTLHVERPPPNAPLTKTATITDGPNGRFDFGKWAQGDLVHGFRQLAEVQLANASNEPQTSQKFYLNVEKEIA